MKISKKRAATSMATLALAIGGGTIALAPTASAASGGGCTGGYSGLAFINSCISATANAVVVGDGYVHLGSVPAGCTVTVELRDVDFNYVVTSRTYGCVSGTQHVVAGTYSNAYDDYRTEIHLNGGSWVWSPKEVMP